MALRLIGDRPGDRLSCHHPRARLLPRHELTPAPGRRTLTISPYANVALVSRTIASTATCPTSATMANAPLAGQDGGSHKVDLPDGASGFLPDGLICRTPSGSARNVDARVRQRPPTSRMDLAPSQFSAACLTRSKNAPLAPLMSEISITVPGWDCVSK